MRIDADAKMVTIFLNSTDQYHGHSVASAIVQRCRQQGIAGATVTRCVEGYGASQQLHTTRLEALMENLPIRVDIVDLPERIESLLTELDGMIDEGLVTIQDVRVRRYLPDPHS